MSKKKPTKSAAAIRAMERVKTMAARRKMPDAVMFATDLYNPFDLRRPSGIMSLDLESGGGLPAGGLSQIDGPESTGKNYLLFQYMRQCQRIYGEEAAIAMACFETTIDKDYARKVGVSVAYSEYEIEAINRSRRERGEGPLPKAEVEAMMSQLGVFVILRGDAANTMDGILELAASGAYQIIGVDSWDTMLTSGEEEKSMTKAPQVAAQAGMHTVFMNKYHAIMNRRVSGGENETTVIGIRQVRADMHSSGMYQREWKSKGAHSLRHGKLVDITLVGGKSIVDTDKRKIGKYVNWEITKGKAGCHEGPKGDWIYYFEPPKADLVADLWATAKLTGAVRREKGVYKIGTLEGEEEGILAAIAKDESLADAIRNEIVCIRGLNIRYR